VPRITLTGSATEEGGVTMRRSSIRVAVATVALLTAFVTSPTDAADCKQVQGHLEERLVPPPDCTSPVGLCTIGQMFGTLKGEAHFTASAVFPSADTSLTSVVFVIGDSLVVDAQLGGKRGSLTVKNAAAFRTVGDGDLGDIQTIIGGTGDFAGATDSLRISGTFVAATGGVSRFEGTVCVP
jgi:hypothetical protein